MKKISLPFLCLALFTVASCVSRKKLEDANLQYNQLKEASAQESARQAQKISALESDAKKMADETARLGNELRECKEINEALDDNLKTMNRTMNEYSYAIRQVYQKVDSAMLKFADAGIDVKYKNGIVYISMRNDFIFNSGTTEIGWEGEQALSVVAQVIQEFPGVTAYILGNTDDKPAKSGPKDSWAASTERANAVVRVLRSKYKVEPERLISGGRGQFHPMGDNETEEGRAKNRRIDVVLNPILDKLWEKSEEGKN